MEQVQILVFNDHGIGHMVTVDQFPKPGETVRATSWHFGEDAGKGTNVAVAAARLGVKSALICRVGDDDEGRLGKKWLEESGADSSHFVLDPAISTNRGIVITQSDGENEIISNSFHDGRMDPEEVYPAIDDYPDTPYFLTGFEIGAQVSMAACRYAKEKGMVTMLNASPLPDYEVGPFEYADYLFVNEVEAMQLTGLSRSAGWEAIAAAVDEQYKPGTVVMTLGGEGSLLCRQGVVSAFEPYETNCVESAGAGDGFMAAFAAAKTRGKTDEEAADFANLYGAVTVSRKGIILTYPTLAEVEAEAPQHPRKSVR